MNRSRAGWIGSLVAVAALLTALAATPAQATKRWTTYERPAEFGIASMPNRPIGMPDGVTLRANVQKPDQPGRYPALIVQTPYGKDGGIGAFLSGASDYFAQRGYAVVTVDVRGTGTSEGTWDSFGPNEQRDGKRVVRWVRDQDWSNGKVGLYGPSYMAITQLYTAAQRPRGLKAIFPIVPLGDGYRDIVFSGGQVNVSFIPLWLGLVTAGGITPSPNALDPDDPLGSLTSALTALADHVAGALTFQIPTVLDATAGGTTAFDGPFWKTRSPLEVLKRIEVPTFVTGGLHDLFQRGEPLVYERLKNEVPTRLLMGPWTHVAGSQGEGLEAAGMPSLNSIALRWFDRWVMGIKRKTHVAAIPKVTQWVYGKDKYVVQRDWPNPKMKLRKRWLRSDGRLLKHPAPEAEAPQSFVQQPLAGICTQSTIQWTAGLGEGIPCTTDNRLDESNGVTYTTRPVKRPLRFIGPGLANLWVTTTAREAVLTVRVSDVAPNGTTTELTSGWLAASFRKIDGRRSRYVGKQLLQPWHSFTRKSVMPVEPGRPVRMRVEIFPTSAAIQPGHSLRISVAPADFPHQVPPLPQFTNSLGGTVRVLTEPGHASFVQIPGVRRHCRAAQCKRMPVARLIRGKP